MLGTSGSRISSSLMRHRKRSVTPLMYSLGCCKLLRKFWQIRICGDMTVGGGQEGRANDRIKLMQEQEAQRDAPDVLVGVLQVVAQVLADQDLRQ